MKHHPWWKSAPARGALFFTLFDVVCVIILSIESASDWVSPWWRAIHSPIHRYLDPLIFPVVTSHPLSISDARMVVYKAASITQFTLIGAFSGFFWVLWKSPLRPVVIRSAALVAAALLLFSSVNPPFEPGSAFKYMTTHANLSVVGDDIEFGLENMKAPGAEANLVVTSWMKKQPRDGWGRPLIYRSLENEGRQSFILYSTGINGIDEGGFGDDIVYDGK